MFGIPGEVFWPTFSFVVIISAVVAGIALLRLLPRGSGTRQLASEYRQTLDDL
jgi:hypothetical protein